MRKAMLLVAGLVVAVLSFLATHSSAHTDAASSVDSFNDMTPAWSPDGTQIAFARELPGGGVSSIYVVRINDGRQRPLTHLLSLTDNRSPSWAPDGSAIAFERSPLVGIFVVRPDGTRLTRLAAKGMFPKWSPNGSTILFQRLSQQCCYTLLYLMDRDGTKQRLLSSAVQLVEPAWSPKSNKIAFEVNPGANPGGVFGSQQIFLIDANGGNKQNMTNNSDSNSSPTWSPDGTKIAFSRSESSREAIDLVNADGSGQRRLTSVSSDARENGYRLSLDSPAWSPDGKKIAFVRGNDCNASAIWLMNADGTGVKRLTQRRIDSAPTWSPDSQRIAFVSHTLGEGCGTHNARIWLVRVTTGYARQLTH